MSGSLSGAGGVGGLLSVVRDTNAYFTAWNGNGNVSEYVDASGDIAAHYEYSPFGETIVATGPNAKDFAHRFSTKYTDDETGLLYYGYRYYSPSLGRWLSRDPIGEKGGVNVLIFTANNPIDRLDILGQIVTYTIDTKVKSGAHGISERIPGRCGEVSIVYQTQPKDCSSGEMGTIYTVPDVVVNIYVWEHAAPWVEGHELEHYKHKKEFLDKLPRVLAFLNVCSCPKCYLNVRLYDRTYLSYQELRESETAQEQFKLRSFTSNEYAAIDNMDVDYDHIGPASFSSLIFVCSTK